MARTQFDGRQILDDSLSGDDIREETLVDSKIPFADSEFLAANIHDAIVEAKNPPHFIYGVVDLDVTIPANRGGVMINPKIGNHEIKIYGELRIL